MSAAWGAVVVRPDLGISKALSDPPPCTLSTCTLDYQGGHHFKAQLKKTHSTIQQQHATALVKCRVPACNPVHATLAAGLHVSQALRDRHTL
jgi:hypothetical protein